MITTKSTDNASPVLPLPITDEVLIRQFKDGQVDAFNVLYARYLPSVYKRVRCVIPVEDVEDVTQEVFIAVLQSLKGFRGESQFGTWLRTLTNYKVAEYYRKRNRKKEAPQTALSEADGKRTGGPTRTEEEQFQLQYALYQLPENYREVLLLRFAEGLQFHQIAEMTGQNLEAVKSLFRRAITKLRLILDNGYEKN
jgi:RNA polymerase sigma-70 factor, ECF subfamily